MTVPNLGLGYAALSAAEVRPESLLALVAAGLGYCNLLPVLLFKFDREPLGLTCLGAKRLCAP